MRHQTGLLHRPQSLHHHPRMPAGKGYADLAFIPKPGCNKPAMIIELKHALTAQDAINQIKAKAYPEALEHYKGDLLLVGVSYDNNKNYDCLIEKIS